MLTHSSELSGLYDEEVENAVLGASGKLISILYDIKHNKDFNQLTRLGDFYKIIKVEEIKEKAKFYTVKMHAEYITKGKNKIINKTIKIYKAYENIDEYINSIRYL